MIRPIRSFVERNPLVLDGSHERVFANEVEVGDVIDGLGPVESVTPWASPVMPAGSPPWNVEGVTIRLRRGAVLSFKSGSTVLVRR